MIELVAESRFFWLHVKQSETGCWEWIGALDKDGYGQLHAVRDGKQTTMRAHRLSFLLDRGFLPDLDIDHLCGNRRCVRPDHLEAVEAKGNENAEAIARIEGAFGRLGSHQTWRE